MFKLKPKWPIPKYNCDDEPHFLFIITPPYSGSTALAELLNSSCRTMFLHNNAEGQWLIPGLCAKNRWNPEKFVNYSSVKASWLNRYQCINKLVKNIDVVIEKSPPNMMRIEQLSSQFNAFSFIANNRNPYANCASMLYRHHNTEALNTIGRAKILEKLARSWLMRSQKIKQLSQKLNIPVVTYEAFCHNPDTLINQLQLPAGVADSINPEVLVKVKDYQLQKISNQNAQQIAKLHVEDIQLLTGIFSQNHELLEFYDYSLLDISVLR